MIRLAWPAVVQGLLTTVVFFTDRLILGGYSDAALGSMSISAPLMWSVFSVFGAISAGTMAVVGRRIGAGKGAEAGEVMGAVLVASALLGLVVAAGGIPLRHTIAAVLAGGMDTSQTIRDMAAVYMGIVFAIAPLKLVGDAGFTALQASGDTRSPMWISGLCGGLNLLLSWLLVGGQLGAPQLGVVGAAIGTAAAFSLQPILVLAVACSPGATFPIRRPTRALSELLGPVARISLPTLGEKGIYHAAYVAFSALVGWLGDVAMTAHQALMAIESLGFMAAGGFGVAASAIVAQRLGAGKPDEAARAGWYATGLSIGALSGVSVLLWVFPEPLIGVFTDDAAIIATGAQCLRIAAVAQPLMALTDGMAGALRGAGDTKNPMIAAIAGPLVVRLSMCWLLAFHLELGLLGIWIGTTLDWAVRGVFLAVVFVRGKWRGIAV
ncbi:MAG: MATE family multidrug resistance protein [Myxococcota bacterium]